MIRTIAVPALAFGSAFALPALASDGPGLNKEASVEAPGALPRFFSDSGTGSWESVAGPRFILADPIVNPPRPWAVFAAAPAGRAPWEQTNLINTGATNSAASSSATTGQAYSIWRDLFACDAPLDRVWSVEFGVAVISDNVPADYMEPRMNKLHGPGGGETYNLTATRRLHQFHWNVGSVTLRPELEVAGRFTLVAENTDRWIPDLNLGVLVRWRDFPWNKYLRTTLAAGPGLSYSFQVLTADYQRHPEDEERSRLQFWLPIELTVALPWFPEHQFVGFIDHQSGGTLFDRGGVDTWGLGYRFEF